MFCVLQTPQSGRGRGRGRGRGKKPVEEEEEDFEDDEEEMMMERAKSASKKVTQKVRITHIKPYLLYNMSIFIYWW